jgi:hypothetical protein
MNKEKCSECFIAFNNDKDRKKATIGNEKEKYSP